VRANQKTGATDVPIFPSNGLNQG